VFKSASVADNCQVTGSLVPDCHAFAKIVVPQVLTLMLYHVFFATQSIFIV
jgi:hypothetical protein